MPGRSTSIVSIFLRRKVPGQTGARSCDLRQHRLALNTNTLTPQSQIAILKKNGSLDSGTRENFSTHNAFSSIALVYYSEVSPQAQGEYTTIKYFCEEKFQVWYALNCAQVWRWRKKCLTSNIWIILHLVWQACDTCRCTHVMQSCHKFLLCTINCRKQSLPFTCFLWK
jgi:hypothetical protein